MPTRRPTLARLTAAGLLALATALASAGASGHVMAPTLIIHR